MIVSGTPGGGLRTIRTPPVLSSSAPSLNFSLLPIVLASCKRVEVAADVVPQVSDDNIIDYGAQLGLENRLLTFIL